MERDTALIIIDMINKMDFDGGKDLIHHTRHITGPIKQLKNQMKQNGLPIIYVNDNFGLWQDNVDELIEECQKGPGAEIIRELLPSEDDYFIIKPKHSGFFGTQLSILLNQLGIKNLILTGVAGDICVLFTANDAYMREYKIWVPSDCVASEKQENNEQAMSIMERSLFAVTSKSTDLDLEDAFKE
ncbi:cysteine hydrolase family protein [Pontibacillus marinus]|uniref:Isochorismatase n=1 Tax=Pontibacillus marinus BH030004 = DSM 16465 TaxID=1385511 RepID=A0A0A5GEC4_9BACI|nr:isochorismatase family cysteine hydrolase [Pontibacillus marinus]KGX89553.1 isochorismatase [Pontibacillus marinus BH030004 = DSM 16465]